jgi:hypothetical protein
MTSTIKNRTLGATALLAVLLGSAACGTDTVTETDPGTQSQVAPQPKGPGGLSADSAERKAAAEKARQDRASTERWARGSQIENKLSQYGHPGRP